LAWYVAQIANRDGRHTVTFPDAPVVCVSADTLESAIERASHTLAWHLESMRAKGMAQPAPTRLAESNDEARATGAVYALVEIADCTEVAPARQMEELPRAQGTAMHRRAAII
jgi:predicted RNase H-like HicB family nuclease